MRAHREGRYGAYTCDDGCSRPFGVEDARTVIASAAARADGWLEIRPGHWTDAGRIMKALKAEDWLRTKSQRASVRKARELLSECSEVS